MRRLALVTAVLGCLLAGCGGGNEESEGGGTQTVAAGKALRVVGREYSFDPENVVAGGGRLEVTLDNRGSLAHNLKVFRGDEELGGTPTFPGGEARSGSLELEPGSYSLICTVGNHADLGMTGKLEIER